MWVYQGAPGDLIKAAVDHGAKGIVIATAGAGATSGTQNEGLNYAAEKGVFVVHDDAHRQRAHRPAAEQSAGEGNNANTAQQRRRQFTIAGEDHTPVKARILLMLALTKTNSRDEIQRMFSEDQRRLKPSLST